MGCAYCKFFTCRFWRNWSGSSVGAGIGIERFKKELEQELKKMNCQKRNWNQIKRNWKELELNERNLPQPSTWHGLGNRQGYEHAIAMSLSLP